MKHWTVTILPVVAIGFLLPRPAAMASDVSTWSTTAASNNAPPPNGWPSVTMLPNEVAPTAREMMAAIKRWYDTVSTHGASHVADNTELAAAAKTTYPNGVWRDDVASGIGAGPLFFVQQDGTCAGASMVNDVGHCVDGPDGNSWVARYPGGIVDVAQFDALCGGQTTLAEFTARTAHDCAVAIQKAVAVKIDGNPATVKLRKGFYFIESAIPLTNQRLAGSGRTETFLLVNDQFDSSATGVIIPNDGSYSLANNMTASEVSDLSIHFEQPSDQTSRAAFKTLSESCTSAVGGSGCQYPWAIYNIASDRMIIHDMQIQAAWNGIYYHRSGPRISHIDISTLNIGIDADEVYDFGYINNYEVHEQFGLCGFGAGACGLSDIYNDGNTYAAKIGRMDGSTFSDWRLWRARIELTSNFASGTFTRLSLDGGNSTLKVDTTNMTAGLKIIGGYSNGSSSGGDSDCSIDIYAGLVSIDGFQVHADGGAPRGLCVRGGNVVWSGGVLKSVNSLQSQVYQTGGTLSITGALFKNATDAAYTQYPVRQSGGALHFSGNTFVDAPFSGSVSAMFLADNAGNYVSNNDFGSWVPMNGVNTYTLGYYNTGDYRYNLTIDPQFTTNGDFSPIAGANTQVGYFYRRGSFVDVEYNWGWDNNAYTTASGAVYLQLSNVPEGLADALGACSIQELDNVTFTSGWVPQCSVGRFGGFEGIDLTFAKSGLTVGGWTTSNIPSGRTGIRIKGSMRYRLR